MTDLVRYEIPAPPVVTDEHIELIKRTVAKDATGAELDLYLYDCKRHGVHPLDKLLHFTKRQGKYTPITSIDLLRSRAADTGELAGINDPSYTGLPGESDFAAHSTVQRFVQGQRCEFSATARWSEYYPGKQLGFMWDKMPYLMLGKCAEALALRKAFPRQLSGLYVREEMDQAGSTEPPARQIPDPASPEKASVIQLLHTLFDQEDRLELPRHKDRGIDLEPFSVGTLRDMAEEHNKLVCKEAAKRFFEYYTSATGKKSWDFADVRRFIGSDMPTPTSYEDWREVARRVQAVVAANKESSAPTTKYEPTPEQLREWEALEASAK